ncbi:15-hydroxyprostaglandin dehydrogenase [nad(+)] [Holotrichia oblita]|uniref:15-hydroxyprostaglandin dehydrogenase [nad(+)] n=1 Tax=Holotrichia oblita TaxID=644536 RepID=A0ACB9T206_HOLOL|nr:15-hydroxyprostaglandin dehydrogenase [nad(+)] [Holotrichia oblita]
MNLSEKVVLITGGSGGLGATCVEELLKNDVKGVVIADINDGEELVRNFNAKYGNGRTIFVKTDVRDNSSFENAFQTAVDTYKNIDILINCAGVFDEYAWEKVLDINLKATARGCLLAINKFFPNYKTNSDTYIINFASITGLVPFELAPHYTASKHGVVGISRSYGCNPVIIGRNIYVMALCPGGTHTAMLAGVDESTVIFTEIMEEQIAALALQQPDVVAKSVIKMLNQPEGGSVWVINGNDLYKKKLPTVETLKSTGDE